MVRYIPIPTGIVNRYADAALQDSAEKFGQHPNFILLPIAAREQATQRAPPLAVKWVLWSKPSTPTTCTATF